MSAGNINNVYGNLVGLDRSLKNSNNRLKTALYLAGGGTTALVTTISAFVGYKAVKPRRRTMEGHPVSPLLPPEKISFKSQDGLKLNGYFYPAQANGETIIVCHGFHGAAADLHQPALTLQAAGYNAFIFDFRGCGESAGYYTSVGYYEVRDVLGAIDYVKSRPEVDTSRIGIYGFSMGGATSIVATSMSEDIKAVVTDSAFAHIDNVLNSSFRHFYRLPHFPFRSTAVLASRVLSRTVTKRVDAAEALRRLQADGRRVPQLIIHGEKDRAIPVSEAHLLYDQHWGPKELWLVPDADHVVARFVDPIEYSTRVIEFFDKHLKKTTNSAFKVVC